MLGAGALGQCRGMVWGGRREEGSGWGTHVYLWWIHFDICQNQYNIVKLKNKKKISQCVNKIKKKRLERRKNTSYHGLLEHRQTETAAEISARVGKLEP